jgi:hypothetical protein
MKHDINRWVFQIPLEDVISKNFPEEEPEVCCLLCGKKITKESQYVHLLTNGNLVSTDQEFSGSEDQGFYPVGNECKDKLPNNFIFKVV